VKVAIIGMGVVGKAQAEMFGDHDLVTWDAAWGLPYPREDIAGCDFAVICVGTPAKADGSCDLGQVRDALVSLPPELPVLIRSTIAPGYTRKWQGCRPGLVAHAPEFLHEREGGPWRSPTDVPWMLLGGSPQAREFFRPRLAQVFPGAIQECDGLTAELAKYTANLYWAARVTFVSEMAAVCRAFGADWEDVRGAWLADERVSPAYTAMAGFEPGFGGRCWPKDLSALVAAARQAGYKAEFLAAIEDANERFRSG
jgi:UDPglucose 6-dehydrogenase